MIWSVRDFTLASVFFDLKTLVRGSIQYYCIYLVIQVEIKLFSVRTRRAVVDRSVR